MQSPGVELKRAGMGIKKTTYRGLSYEFRRNSTFDSCRLRVWNEAKGTDIPISARVDTDLAALNAHLKGNNLREDTAPEDQTFKTMLSNLLRKYADAHGLKEYRCRERVANEGIDFDFNATLDAFVEYKRETSAIPARYKQVMEHVWRPFFSAKGCTHPNQWKNHRAAARAHIKLVKQVNSEKGYSHHYWVNIASVLNGWMAWLHQEGFLPNRDDVFELSVAPTKEQKKRFGGGKRKRDTYSFDEIYDMRSRIDKAYTEDLEWKVRAYAMLFGVCTGLRRGNLLGLKGRDLYPDAKIPYFAVSDNVVAGGGRLEKGTLVLEVSTKTTVGSVIHLPMLQPDRSTLCEIARFLKENVHADSRILDCSPSSVQDFWEKVAKDCGFRVLNPHAWKHSYATNGALNFQTLYKSNPALLQKCCMHEDYRTTEQYLDLKNRDFLEAF